MRTALDDFYYALFYAIYDTVRIIYSTALIGG